MKIFVHLVHFQANLHLVFSSPLRAGCQDKGTALRQKGKWSKQCWCLADCFTQAVQQYQQRRNYSTQTRGDGPESAASKPVAESTGAQLSQREKLKRAVKEYGSTVIVFHVAISLVSLGGFYLAVSRCVWLFLLVHNLLIVLLTNSFFSGGKKKNKKNTQ